MKQFLNIKLTKILIFSILLISCLSCLNLNRANSVREENKANQPNNTVQNSTNSQTNNNTNQTILTISNALYNTLNESNAVLDIYKLIKDNQLNDFKLTSKQIEEIFGIFLTKNGKSINSVNIRAIIEIFTKNFDSCDANHDNKLDIVEFTNCLKTNNYFFAYNIDKTRSGFFSDILTDNQVWTNITNTEAVANSLFKILDENRNHFLTFYEFLKLRIVAFSLRKCNFYGFFVSEGIFECGIELIANGRTLHKEAARSLFKLGLTISNFQNTRDLDIITYTAISLQARLFYKINLKDGIATGIQEFKSALEANALPRRYNQDAIDAFYSKFDKKQKNDFVMDIYQFIFYDTVLVHYDKAKFNTINKGLTYDEFRLSMITYNFPKHFIEPLFKLYRFKLTKESFGTVTAPNIAKIMNEGDLLLRFKEKTSNKQNQAQNTQSNQNSQSSSSQSSNKVTTTTTTTTTSKSSPNGGNNIVNTNAKEANTNLQLNKNPIMWYFKTNYAAKEFDWNFITKFFFDISETNNLVEFKDYLYFIEACYVFRVTDKENLAYLNADRLKNGYTNFGNQPRLISVLQQDGEIFSLLNKDLTFNFYYTFVLLRLNKLGNNEFIQDFQKITIEEPRLQIISKKIRLNNSPKKFFDECLTTANNRNHNQMNNLQSNTALYDLSCALRKAASTAVRILETTRTSNQLQHKQIALTNTALNVRDKNIFNK